MSLSALKPPFHFRRSAPCASYRDIVDLNAEPLRDLPPELRKMPVSNINTRSPGESVLTMAASQAPVPEAG